MWAPAWRRAGGHAGKSSTQQSGRKPIFEGAGPLGKLYFKVPDIKRPQAGYYKIVFMLRHSFPSSFGEFCTRLTVCLRKTSGGHSTNPGYHFGKFHLKL